MSRTILLGLVLVGILVAAGVGALAVTGSSAPAGADLTIPVGRVGDHVEYKSTINDSTLTLDVVGYNEVKDSTGAPHISLVMKWEAHGFAAPDSMPNATSLDLSDRSLVRRDIDEILGGGTIETIVALGPEFTRDRHAPYDLAWIFAQYQGRSLEESSDASAILGPVRAAHWSTFDPWFWDDLVLESYQHDSRVVDERSIRTHDVVTWTIPQVGGTVQESFHEEFTFDGASPYPTGIFLSGEHPNCKPWYSTILTRCHEEGWTRTAYTPGDAEIAWGTALKGPSTLQLGESPGFPHSGDEWEARAPRTDRGPVTVEEAIAAVEQRLATLPGFASWREAHADSRLVGYAVARTGTTLYYGAPQGDSVYWLEVRDAFSSTGATIRGVPVVPPVGGIPPAVTVIEKNGNVPNPRPLADHMRFSASDVPTTFTTLSAAAGRLSEFGLDPPSYANWGYAFLPICERRPDEGCDRSQSSSRLFHALEVYRTEFATIGLDASGLGVDNFFGGASVEAVTGDVVGVGSGAAHITMVKAPVAAAVLPPAKGPADQRGGMLSSPTVAAAAAGTSLLLILLLIADMLPFVKYGATSLYTRLQRSKVLDNELREAILASIAQDPGVSPPQLQKDLGAGWSTIVYHLRVLEENGFVTSRIDGRHKRFFHAGAFATSDLGALAILANANTRKMHELIQRTAGLDRVQLASELSMTPEGTRWHLQRLSAAGLVFAAKDGRALRYHAVGGETRAPRAEG